MPARTLRATRHAIALGENVNKLTPSLNSSCLSAPMRPQQLFLVVFAIAAAWIGGFCVVTTSRVFASLYHSLGFGADLPLPTALTFRASQNHIPWLFALVATVLLVYLFVRASRYLAMACAVVSAVGMIAVSIAALSLALPNYNLCADVALWPDWPDWQASTSSAPPAAANAQRARLPGIPCQ